MSSEHKVVLSEPRYEFRVWGSFPEVNRRLSSWADEETHQEVEDHYLLVGGYAVNAKIRRRKLKIKRLLELRDGFERWSVHRRRLDRPFDDLDGLPDNVFDLGRSRSGHGQFSLMTEDSGRFGWDGEVVLVTKRRRRFRLGSLRAEVSEMRLDGQRRPLRTVAIEGRDLADLVELRQSLAIAELPNRAVHLAVEDRYRAAVTN